jgi:hypothetical protein
VNAFARASWLTCLPAVRVAGPNLGVSQEQDYRRRIAEITDRLDADRSSAGLREPAIAARDAGATRAELAAAQSEYARLIAQMRERNPRYASLVSARTNFVARGFVAPKAR